MNARHDPFGLADALAHAAAPRSVLWRIGARALEWGVSALALTLPVFLLAAAAAWWATPRDPLRAFTLVTLLVWVGSFLRSTLRLRRTQAPERGPDRSADRRVAVIGAGPVGLCAVKECRAKGLEVTCFERQDGIGGVYRRNDTFPGGVWDSVRLTTSPWVTAFSDFPPESDSSEQLSHAEYLAYLERYADAFELRASLRCGVSVEGAELGDDGRWTLRVRERASGSVSVETFDHLIVCSGLNLQPKGVSLDGLETFTGTVQHVATYKDPTPYAGKDVVVVGIGESGADIAAELCGHARPRLSIRRGKFIIPRINPLNGVANDYDTNRARYATPVAVRNAFMTFRRRLCAHTGELTPEAALRARLLEVSRVGPMSQTVTKNDAIIPRLREGTLELRRPITRLDGDEVVYQDGFRERADAILFAHGYQPHFPFLERSDLYRPRHPGLLFLNMVDPSLGDKLIFCGFARPAVGSIPPSGELQARLAAAWLSGERALPSASEMEADVAAQNQRLARLYPTQRLPHVVISWIDYNDRIADAIGCRPDPWRLLWRPRLAWKVATGPATGATYRLHGPGAAPVAEATVLRLPRMHQLRELLTHIGLHALVWPLAATSPDPVWRSSNSIW